MTRTCGAVIARVMIAMLVLAMPLATPVLADRALAMIRADHGGRVTVPIIRQAGRPRPGDAGRHRGASPRETRSR